ncbi:MAG: glycosyltransferase family 39 protein [Anaerolineae bacterium]
MTRQTSFSSRLATHSAAILSVLILLAFAIRIGSINFQSLWRDEVDAIRFALAPLPDLIKTFTQPGFNGPLYFLMLRGWIGLAGQSEFAIRFPSLIFGVLSVPLIFVVGTRLFNRSIGLVAALLLTVSGYHVWYSQEAKMYTLITLLALIGIYCLRHALEDGRVRFWIGMVVSTSLAVYAHILAALIIPVEFGLFLLWCPPIRRRVRDALIAFGLLTIPYLPLAIWQLPLVLQPAATGYGRYTLSEMISILGGGYARGLLTVLPDFWQPLAAGLAAALAVFGLTTALTTKGQRLSGAALFVWLAVPFFAIFIVSLNRPIFTDRYLIWIMPAYYVLIAAGIRALWVWLKPMAVIGLAGVIVFASAGLIGQSTIPYKSDFRSATQFIERSFTANETVLFQIPYVQYIFDYYFHQPYTPLAGPYTNYPGPNDGFQDTEQAIWQHLDELFKDRSSVWFVASEVPMWDQRNLVQRWLDAHGTRLQHGVFAQVEVTHYQLSGQ